MFTTGVCSEEPETGHALVVKVLNATEDPDAPPVPNVGAAVPNVGAAVPNVGAAVPNVGAAVPNVGAAVPNVGAAVPNAAVAVPNAAAQVPHVPAADLTAAGDHDALAVHNAGVFPHVAPALSGKGAHNCAQVDPGVARGLRFAPGVHVPGVQVAPSVQCAQPDPIPPAAGSFQGVPTVHFVQAALLSQGPADVPQGSRFPLPAVWLEQLMDDALAASHRWCPEQLSLPDVPVADYALAVLVGQQYSRAFLVRSVLDQVDQLERAPDELVAQQRLWVGLRKHLVRRYRMKLSSVCAR